MAISIETLVLAKNFAKSYTDAVVATFPRGMVYRGAVDYYSDLPSNAEVGDVYTVKYAGSTGEDPLGAEYGWGTYDGVDQWIDLGPDLSNYQPLLVSGTNIKTINGNSILGSGDITIDGYYELHTYAVKTYTSADSDYEQLKDDIQHRRDFIRQYGSMYYCNSVSGNDYYYKSVNGSPASGNIVVDTLRVVISSDNISISTSSSNTLSVPQVTALTTSPTSGTSMVGLRVGTTSYKLDYLPLSGGTMTGSIVAGGPNNGVIIKTAGNKSILYDDGSSLTSLGHNDAILKLASKNADIQRMRGSDGPYYILDTYNTSANPTLVGTEAALTGLKINGTSYKIPTFDPTTISGYDATKTQVLTNNNGTIEWTEATTFAALNSAQYGTPDVTLFAVADGSVLATSDTSEPVAPAVE